MTQFVPVLRVEFICKGFKIVIVAVFELQFEFCFIYLLKNEVFANLFFKK